MSRTGEVSLSSGGPNNCPGGRLRVGRSSRGQALASGIPTGTDHYMVRGGDMRRPGQVTGSGDACT